jgi:hypothetical protein
MSRRPTVAEQRKAAASQDAGQSEVKDMYEEAQKKGFFGVSPSPIENKEYSLETGPKSPSAFDGHVAHAEALLKQQKEAGQNG